MKSLFYPVLLLFHAVFISLGNDSKMIKYICVVLLMVYLFHKKRFILQRKYRTVNQALLLFGGTVLFSSIHMLTIHFPPGFKEVSAQLQISVAYFCSICLLYTSPSPRD